MKAIEQKKHQAFQMFNWLIDCPSIDWIVTKLNWIN